MPYHLLWYDAGCDAGFWGLGLHAAVGMPAAKLDWYRFGGWHHTNDHGWLFKSLRSPGPALLTEFTGRLVISDARFIAFSKKYYLRWCT